MDTFDGEGINTVPKKVCVFDSDDCEKCNRHRFDAACCTAIAFEIGHRAADRANQGENLAEAVLKEIDIFIESFKGERFWVYERGKWHFVTNHNDAVQKISELAFSMATIRRNWRDCYSYYN
ncbi:MAG: hypothetical protein QMD86_01880 [Patescibacteria group bacterium]|nr:hypothetical protein [Patescibacteria group bacterium]